MLRCNSARVAPPALLCGTRAEFIYTSPYPLPGKKSRPHPGMHLCSDHAAVLRKDLKRLVPIKEAASIDALFRAC